MDLDTVTSWWFSGTWTVFSKGLLVLVFQQDWSMSFLRIGLRNVVLDGFPCFSIGHLMVFQKELVLGFLKDWFVFSKVLDVKTDFKE